MSTAAPAGAPAPDLLQDGIYFRPGQEAARCWRLLLLNIRPGTTPRQARAALAALWAMLQDLRRGVVRDLGAERPGDPEVRVPESGLQCLLGFGARLFNPDLHAPRLAATDDRPLELVMLRSRGPVAPFPQLRWAAEPDRLPGEADLALQFTADTELAANRAVVEVWKILMDQQFPLDLVALHSGFRREDFRSWLDFHDGLSNIEASQRRGAIEVVVADPPWMEGGAYLAFLRLAIDLAGWRRLSRAHQEILIGRDKLTGAPLERVERLPDGTLLPRPLPPPGPASLNPFETLPPSYLDPGRPGDPLLQMSHVHRANHNRGAPDTDANNRIFRQAYDFLEARPDGTVAVGLNFVSFQRSLARLTQILRVSDWLGEVNFGGPSHPDPGEPEPLPLLSVLAGGYYAVPPRGDPFPGAGIF